MLRILLGTSALLAMSLPPAPALANEEDANIWLAQTATINLGEDMTLWLEAQERFTNDASRLGQLLLRPAIGYRLDSTTTISLGYAYVQTDPLVGATTEEHRIFQQLSTRVAGDGRGTTVTARTRLEQRFFAGQEGTGWRLRQQVRLTAPLVGKTRLAVWTEPFIGLNQTPFQRDGIGLWRSFAGLSAPLVPGVTIEPGYLNQQVRRTGRDRTDHVANLTIATTF
jgi:hypothetical protein